MSNTRYLRCAKCGCNATPHKWDSKTPKLLAEVGTSTTMCCADCCTPSDPHATMCRDCCPTGHGTRFQEETPHTTRLSGPVVHPNTEYAHLPTRLLTPGPDEPQAYYWCAFCPICEGWYMNACGLEFATDGVKVWTCTRERNHKGPHRQDSRDGKAERVVLDAILTTPYCELCGSRGEAAVLKPTTYDVPAEHKRYTKRLCWLCREGLLQDTAKCPTCRKPYTPERLSDLVDGTPDEINATIDKMNRTDAASQSETWTHLNAALGTRRTRAHGLGRTNQKRVTRFD